MAFRVGQRVCCVDDEDTDVTGAKELCVGRVYTVRWVGAWGFRLMFPVTPSIRVDGIMRGEGCFGDPPSHIREHFYDMPFDARRFRPVVSTESGMAILEQIRRDVSNKTALPIREDA